MTTIVTVKANHGWPVKVQQLHPETGDAMTGATIVPAGKEQDFVCHSSADLHIHEVQPGEEQSSDVA